MDYFNHKDHMDRIENSFLAALCVLFVLYVVRGFLALFFSVKGFPSRYSLVQRVGGPG